MGTGSKSKQSNTLLARPTETEYQTCNNTASRPSSSYGSSPHKAGEPVLCLAGCLVSFQSHALVTKGML